jgi:hypothetical protein
MPTEPYRIALDDPRAPSQEVWEQLTSEERACIVESLPSEFSVSPSSPPKGDLHFEAKVRTREVLSSFFSRIGRKVYVACELPVYYPCEPMLAPDVIAMVDVKPHSRMHWMVSAEGKGVDLALEIHVAGERRKELVRNVERFARLGIREYFLFDRRRLRLTGWRLEAGRRIYQPIVPQRGFYSSEVLGLELQLEGKRLRFFSGRAPLPESDEMIATLERMVREAEEHRSGEERLRTELEQRLAEESRLRAEESRLREEAERRLAEVLAELERLPQRPC